MQTRFDSLLQHSRNIPGKPDVSCFEVAICVKTIAENLKRVTKYLRGGFQLQQSSRTCEFGIESSHEKFY